MADPRYFETPPGPLNAGAAVTPNDGVDLVPPAGLPVATRALVVGVGGTVTVNFPNGGTNITMTLPAGIHPLSVTRVYATGTAATGIVALY